MRPTLAWDGRIFALLPLCTAYFAAILWLAALPYYYGLEWLWPRASAPVVLYAAILSFFAWVITSILLLAIVKRVLRIRTPRGRYRTMSWRGILWAFCNAHIVMARFLGLELFRCTPLMTVFFSIMGCRIGSDVILNSTYLYDLELIEIGDGTVIGGDAVILAHSAENRWFSVQPVSIGRNVTIGQSATILAGSVIGDGAVIGAMSLVPRQSEIPPRTVWSGVPVRQVEAVAAKLRAASRHG